MQTALQEWQNLRRQSTCPRADLQDAQAASFGQTSSRRAHGSGDGREPVTAEETVAIELIEQLRADPREQDLHRILFAAQNRTQLCTVPFAKERLGKMSGVLLDVVSQNLRGGTRRLSKIRRQLKSRVFFPEQTAPNETGHQPFKDG